MNKESLKYNHIYGIDTGYSHYDLVFTKINSLEINSGIQGGLDDSQGETLITIIRKGGFVFDLSKALYSTYFSEKLFLHYVDGEGLLNILKDRFLDFKSE